jgi:hypothetical protein
MPRTVAARIEVKIEEEVVERGMLSSEGSWEESSELRVRIVCKGSSASQDSI